jgi:transposase-like protein
MPRSYPPEFRRRALDLVASGQKVAEVAKLLDSHGRLESGWGRRSGSGPCGAGVASTWR